MKIKVEILDSVYETNLAQGHDISILVGDHNSPVAFGAPEIEIKPYRAGNYIGSLESGSPVNFYNIKLNPHGNTTHTETARHITNEAPEIGDLLKTNHFIAQLVTATPEEDQHKNKKVGFLGYDWESINWQSTEALIIRTTPNTEEKKYQNYTGKNPTYMDNGLISWLTDKIEHLLVDIPSVDPEKDEGRLLGHRAFWSPEKKKAFDKTITELIFVDSTIEDGLYLLNLQTMPLMTDASPSRPVIYPLKRL